MKAILFTLYNHFYKDGENKRFKSFQPMSVIALSFSIIVGFLLSFFYYSITGLKIRNFTRVLYFLFAVAYAGSYYFFISKKGFEKLYNAYKNGYTPQELKKFTYYTMIFYGILFFMIIYFVMRINEQSITNIPFRR